MKPEAYRAPDWSNQHFGSVWVHCRQPREISDAGVSTTTESAWISREDRSAFSVPAATVGMAGTRKNYSEGSRTPSPQVQTAAAKLATTAKTYAAAAAVAASGPNPTATASDLIA